MLHPTLALTAAAALILGAAACASAVKAEPQPGDEAPAFELAGTDGKTHRLSDYKGKQAVVVAWFPKAFTGG